MFGVLDNAGAALLLLIALNTRNYVNQRSLFCRVKRLRSISRRARSCFLAASPRCHIIIDFRVASQRPSSSSSLLISRSFWRPFNVSWRHPHNTPCAPLCWGSHARNRRLPLVAIVDTCVLVVMEKRVDIIAGTFLQKFKSRRCEMVTFNFDSFCAWRDANLPLAFSSSARPLTMHTHTLQLRTPEHAWLNEIMK